MSRKRITGSPFTGRFHELKRGITITGKTENIDRRVAALERKRDSFPFGTIAVRNAWDPASIAAGSSTATTFSVPGTRVGDIVVAGLDTNTDSLMISGLVTTNGTVKVVAFNPTGSAIDPGLGVVRILIFQFE